MVKLKFIINILICNLLILGVCSLSLKADQNDPKLEKLFQSIKDTKNENELAVLTSSIWTIWYETEDYETQILFNQGTGLLESNSYEESLNIFNSVIKQSPNFAEGWNKRATLHFLMGNYDESIKDINKTLSLEPRHFGALDGLGQIYYQRQNFNDAINAYKRLLVIIPHSSNAKRMLEMINDKFV